MATISNASLVIENLNDTTVTTTIRYRLTPTPIEKLAGSVFSENIRLIGDDPGVLTDIVITTLPDSPYAVTNATNFIDRVRTRSVLKSALNEDPLFLATGAETPDEVFARIAVTYAASAPAIPTLPSPVSTAMVIGAWR